MIFNMSGGGGAALNFKVMGGTAEPSNPVENTIWINTDAKITGWLFSSHQPENPAEGMVWIATGSASNAEFNALKKNGITVYPMSAKQYVNGAWVNKPIKVYQSGSWKDALLYTVVPNTGITWSKEKNVTVTQNADSTVFSHGAGDDTVHYADFSVDLTPYTKLKIVGNVSASAWSDSNSVKISIGAFSTNASFVTGFTQDIYNRDGTININNTYDISSLSGIYLIRYNACRNNDADSSHTCKFIATSIELS